MKTTEARPPADAFVPGNAFPPGDASPPGAARPGAALARILLALWISIAFVSSVLAARSGAAESAAEARASLVHATGVTSLALSGECSAVRHLGEGLQACLGDVAGGYCYHNSCDLVTMPCLSGWSDPKSASLAVRPPPPEAGGGR